MSTEPSMDAAAVPGGGAATTGGGGGGGELSAMFKMLCDNVTTAMLNLNTALHEYLQFKDELLEHKLPSNLLLTLTILSSRLFRSYSDLCTPVGELSRLTQLHSSPWESKAESLRKIRSDYESMQRKLNIALKKLQMMAAESDRAHRMKVLGHWEKVFCHVMKTQSHGRRWKFRIEPFKRKLAAGFNPYLSESDSDDVDIDGEEESPYGNEDDIINNTKKPVANQHKEEILIDTESSESTPPTPPPPPVVTIDVGISTDEPLYDNYLLVQLSRPRGVLPRKDICCTLSFGTNFFTSEVFPGKVEDDDTPQAPQTFHFPLTEEEGNTLSPDGNDSLPRSSTRLLVGIYPRNISESLVANLSLPLEEIRLTDPPDTVVTPPVHRGEEFELDWDGITAGLSGSPADYPLTMQQEKSDYDSDDDDIDTPPLVPILCHRVKVQRYRCVESSDMTQPWDELMSEMGYRHTAETESRAASALPYEPTPPPSPTQGVEQREEELREELEKETQQRLGELSLQHMEELKHLQFQYEEKLNALSGALNRVKAEKSRQIQDLEQAVAEMEKSRGAGKKGKSMADIQRAIARRRKAISLGLPEWGKDLPDDFFERLELFKDESIRKQEELIARIRREVSEVCEKQLATQHKLAPPGPRYDMESITEDVSLPAVFMPTPLSKHLVYTPRAHKYFHPSGSTEIRVTQPPAVFKLPALQTGLQTLNLFELSQHFSQTGPQWLREQSARHQSPHLTPAPPPSACDYYHHAHTAAVATQQGAAATASLPPAEREDREELDYGGLDYRAQGTYKKHGDRVTFKPNRTY